MRFSFSHLRIGLIALALIGTCVASQTSTLAASVEPSALRAQLFGGCQSTATNAGVTYFYPSGFEGCLTEYASATDTRKSQLAQIMTKACTLAAPPVSPADAMRSSQQAVADLTQRQQDACARWEQARAGVTTIATPDPVATGWQDIVPCVGGGCSAEVAQLPVSDARREFLPIVAKTMIYAASFTAFVMFFVAGTMMVFAWGGEDGAKKAKTIIIWGIVGLCFAAAAYVLVRGVLDLPI